MSSKQKPNIHIGETPQRQVAPETPRISAPGVAHQFTGGSWWGYWLGDTERRYGRMQLSRRLPAETKLEMLRDPVIALAMGFITATLIKAKRIVECTDDNKRRFFEAVVAMWEREFLTQAAQAVALGSCGLVKRWAFRIPPAIEVGDPPVWTAATTPYIVEGFDAVYPVNTSPAFDRSGRHFQGINAPEGKVDVFFSLWITMGKARAFGAYGGSGRLETVYRDWWAKQFSRDLYLVWLQKNANPIATIGYPPGQTETGTDHRDIAVDTGDAARGGATVALPSTVYTTVDSMTASEAYSSIKKWTLEFLETGRPVDQFHEIEDHHDQKISLGMLLPPQMYLNVKQSALGGPTTADVLTQLAEELLLLDAADLDAHLNNYVFAPMDKANFPPDSPRVRLRTVGLVSESRSQLFEIVKTLVGRMDVNAHVVDLPESLRRLGVPIDMEQTEELPMEPPEETPTAPAAPAAQAAQAAQAADDKRTNNPPDDALLRIAQEELTPIPGPGACIPSEADARRALRKLKQLFPEAFENGQETPSD